MKIAFPAADFDPAAAHVKYHYSLFVVNNHAKQWLYFRPEEVNSIDDSVDERKCNLCIESEV